MSADYAAARFTDAAAVFDRNARQAPAQAVLLRARICLKRSDAAGAIRYLTQAKTEDNAAQAERLMLLGAARARMERFPEADEDFAEALALAKAPALRELRAEIAYRRAVRYVQSGNAPEARKQLLEARNSSSKRAQINAMEGESFLLGAERRYTEQARVLIKTLEDMDPHGDEFVESRAWAAHTLAVLTRELFIPEAVPLVERHLEAGSWPPDLAVNRFQGFKAVGWAHALRGDYFNAFRYLKRSLSVAPDTSWRAIALADRAHLAECIGERRWARQELLEAEQDAAEVDWETMRGEEPIALLLIAEMLAPIDQSQAAYYVARFDELGGVRDRLLHFRNDERLKNLAAACRAKVEIALGNSKRGATLLNGALRFFGDIGYDWRAGRCALDLYELTADRAYLKIASEKLRNYSTSWLGDRLRRLQASSSTVQLPPMQQKVFDGICRGLSNAEIAREIGRSEFTVANHVKVLLRTFGVSSRSALLAEAVRLNMLPGQANNS